MVGLDTSIESRLWNLESRCRSRSRLDIMFCVQLQNVDLESVSKWDFPDIGPTQS